MTRGLDPKLRQILRAEKRIYFVTSGTTADAAEQFFTGAGVTQALNRRAVFFTTDRVLLLQIDRNKKPRELTSQIAYISIAEVKPTWNGYCQLKLLNKSKMNFIGVPKADRQQLGALLGDLVKANTATAAANGAPALEHLCPHCFVSVPGHPAACPSCHGNFKLARTAMLRSLIFPGLGDLYLGHTTFAVMEMLGAAGFLYVMVVGPLLGLPDEKGVVTETNPLYWAIACVLIAGVHGIDAMMTRRFALKSHHPA